MKSQFGFIFLTIGSLAAWVVQLKGESFQFNPTPTLPTTPHRGARQYFWRGNPNSLFPICGPFLTGHAHPVCKQGRPTRAPPTARPTTPAPTRATTPEPPTPPPPCVDSEASCGDMAKKGYCETSKAILDSCKTSCNQCPGQCADNSYDCFDKIDANPNACKDNPGYMNVHCKKSCKICSSTSTKCEDLQSGCGGWAKSGDCTKYPKYMNANCRDSCGLCVPPPKACTDNNANCKIWAREGECEKSKDFMATDCKKSCGLC